MRKLLLTSFLMLVSVVVSVAQITTSSISGQVTDEKNSPVLGAAVIAIHTPSGTQYGVSTDAKGNYRITNMRPGGPYTVSIQMLGFTSIENTGVQLGLADNTVLDYVMREETLGIDAIVVRTDGTNSSMNSDRAGAMTNISTDAIVMMPTVSRSLTDITRLTPQANGSSIRGGTDRQNNITIDGASFNNKFGIGQSMPANGSPISLDAIEQVSVSVTPYDVRQSGFLGAAVNAVTRSGDNEFRGSVYTYLNNEKFRGNRVGDEQFERVENRYNLYGFRIGGPIIKNKLFFFVNAEMEKNVSPGPTKVARDPGQAYDSKNTNVSYATSDMMKEISDHLQSKYGYETGPWQGYSFDSPKYKILARIDWNIHRNHRFNIRYNMTKGKTPLYPSTSTSQLANSSPFTQGNRRSNQAIWFQNTGYFQEENFYALAAELNSTFGKLNNQLRVSYTSQDEPRSTGGSQFPFVDIRIKDGGSYDGQALTSFGTELFSYGNLRQVNTISISDDLTWSMGINNFTAGVQYEHNRTRNGFQRFGTGYYTYDSWEDFKNGAPALQFALTHPNNASGEQAFPEFNFNQLTAYIQDELNISYRFKLLAGLRIDLPMYPDINTYNSKVAEIEFRDGMKFDTGKLPKAKPLFSPRLGFNFDILGDRSLVLRGGTGIFTGTIPFVWIVAQASDAGVLQTTYTTKDPLEIPAFYTNTKDMMNAVYPGGFTPGDPLIPSSAVIMDPDLKLPQVWKSSLALDAKLPWDIRGSIEGIYSTDVNAVAVDNVGIKEDSRFKISGYADQRYIWKQDYYHTRLKNMYMLTNGGSNYYWSVTAKLEKQFSREFHAMVAYTHSAGKSHVDNVGDQVGSVWSGVNTVNGSNSWEMGYSSYIIPDKIIASISYRKEYARHFATSVSLFYRGSQAGRYSYTYINKLNNDNGGYSLMYVPKDDSEITFVDLYDKNNNLVSTAAEQRTDFWNYINDDKYLSSRKGKYAERGGGVLPWEHQFDIKFMQDFFFNVNGKRNTIQVGLDIMNFTNMLNKKWGVTYSSDAPYVLNVSNMSNVISGAGTVAPEFTFNKNNAAYKKNITYASTYFMQFSLRYIFN